MKGGWGLNWFRKLDFKVAEYLTAYSWLPFHVKCGIVFSLQSCEEYILKSVYLTSLLIMYYGHISALITSIGISALKQFIIYKWYKK